MSVLDEIIAGATDDSVSTANLLRKVVVTCHRLGADEARGWAESELSGYSVDEVVPPYRGPMGAIVKAHYAGPGGSSATATLSSASIPDWFQQFFQLTLRQPLEVDPLRWTPDSGVRPEEGARVGPSIEVPGRVPA